MTNISYMGRCDLCGKPIDMEHAGHDLVVYEEPAVEGYPEYDITRQDMREAFADALRMLGGVENDIVADVYAEDGALILHGTCMDVLTFPDPGVDG